MSMTAKVKQTRGGWRAVLYDTDSKVVVRSPVFNKRRANMECKCWARSHGFKYEPNG